MRWWHVPLLCAALALPACHQEKVVRKDDPNWRVRMAKSDAPLVKDTGPPVEEVEPLSDLLEMEGKSWEDRRALAGAVDDRAWDPHRAVAAARPKGGSKPGPHDEPGAEDGAGGKPEGEVDGAGDESKGDVKASGGEPSDEEGGPGAQGPDESDPDVSDDP